MAFIENSEAKEWRIAAACGVAFLVLVAFSWIETAKKSPQQAPSDKDHAQSDQNTQAHFPDQSQELDQMTQQSQRGEPIDLDKFMKLSTDEQARKKEVEENPGIEGLKKRIKKNQQKLAILNQCIGQEEDLAKQSEYDADNAVRQGNRARQQTQLESPEQLRWPGQPAADGETGSTNEPMQPSEEAVGVDMQRRYKLKELYRQKNRLEGLIGEDTLRLKFRRVPGY
jgi:hypothetical protein